MVLILSLGYEFDAEMFACGQSPLCIEVDRLVRSGVVVVVATENAGLSRYRPCNDQPKSVSTQSTIRAIPDWHSNSPGLARHAYGVSYFSSAGPLAMAGSNRTS